MVEGKGVKKEVKTTEKSVTEKAVKESAKATLLALAKTETSKGKAAPAAVKAPSGVQVKPQAAKAEEKAKPVVKPEPQIKPEMPKAEAVKEPAKPVVKPEPQIKPEMPKAEAVKEPAKPEASKAEAKAEAKKETDPSKEFVDAIMVEMALKGAPKKRLVKNLAEQYNFDKQKVLFKLKRALITERYAAAHEAGAGGH